MIDNHLKIFNDVIAGTRITDIQGHDLDLTEGFKKTIHIAEEIRKKSGFLFLVGNGGSSAIISHLSIDLINSCRIKAYPITDNSHITCFANDFGYDNVFGKPLETMASPGDGLIAVSSSGASDNIINAVKAVQDRDVSTVTFSGFKKDNPLRQLGDVNFWLDCNEYGIVEVGHSFLLHVISDNLMLSAKP